MADREPYLAVKNWRTYQHYSDRRPPWIKLMRELIDGDNGRKFRDELTEQEQYQLVRIWLYASGSDVVFRDEKGVEIPLIPNDEKVLRSGIRSTKKIPLAKLVTLGFLTPSHGGDASEQAESTGKGASTAASNGASTAASTIRGVAASAAASTLANARASGREQEELLQKSSTEDQEIPRAVNAPSYDATPEDAGPPDHDEEQRPWDYTTGNIELLKEMP